MGCRSMADHPAVNRDVAGSSPAAPVLHEEPLRISGRLFCFPASCTATANCNCELCSHGGADARRLATAFLELGARGDAQRCDRLNVSRGGAGSAEDCNGASNCFWHCVRRCRHTVRFETLIGSREIASGADNNDKLLQLPVSVVPRLRASRVAIPERVCAADRANRRASAVAVPRAPRVSAVSPAHRCMRRRTRVLRPRPTVT